MRRVWEGLRSEWQRIRGLGRRRAQAQRLDEEIEFHLGMLIERHERAGMTPSAARHAALVEFGGVDRYTESARDEYRSRPLEDLGRDVSRAVRNLVRMPAFTAAAVVTLALGIGATTVMYSIVDHVVLRPLPYHDADRLVIVREVIDEVRDEYPSLAANASHFLEWRERCAVCADVAALRGGALTWSGGGDPVRLDAIRVSPNLLALLGVRPLHGRLFREEESADGAADVVILSHAFWTREFAANAGIIGETITLSERPRTVVGVLPPQFRLPKRDELGERTSLPDDAAFYVPLKFAAWELESQGGFDYIVLARLRPGVTLAQARRQFDDVQADISTRVPLTLSAAVMPLQGQVVGGARRGLLLLLGAVGSVLLLVCVNLASLLLARNATRARESAVRVALGAGRGRLVRESLTESVVLALCAGLVGLVLARGGLAALLRFAPPELPRLHEVQFDARIALAGLLLSLLTGVLFGVLPAVRAAAGDPNGVLKSGGRTQTDARHAARARASLIAAQIALTTVLLVAAGLFLASFARVLGVDRGFRVEHALALDVVVPNSAFADGSEIPQIYERLLDRLRTVPGTIGVAATSRLPLDGLLWADMMSAENDTRPDEERPLGNFHFVTPDYFTTLDIPLRRGRAFAATDRGRNVVVLSERAAVRLFPAGEDPVGRRVQLGGQVIADVVGVAADVAATGIDTEPGPIVYLPPWTPLGLPPALSVVVRTATEPLALAGTVRGAIRAAGSGIAVARVRTLEQMVSDATAARRFQLSLLLLFALTALVTACVGIYGVVAHALAGRRGEIGVRMALGARRGDIHRLVLGEGIGAAAAGLLAGIAAALVLGRFVQSLLFGVRPAEPAVLAAVALLLGAAAAAASYIPARRASARAVAVALRQE